MSGQGRLLSLELIINVLREARVTASSVLGVLLSVIAKEQFTECCTVYAFCSALLQPTRLAGHYCCHFIYAKAAGGQK